MQLQDKVALVTGAGSGIGQASAFAMAEAGARIAALGRTESELAETVQKIESNGGKALIVLADQAKPEEVEQGYQKVIDQWGQLDIVFANAGINGVWAPLESLTPEEWKKTIDINLNGTF